MTHATVDFTALAARVERMNEPDRDVDVLIWRALAYAIPARHPADYDSAPAYTGSIDAAKLLIPKGLGISMSEHGRLSDDCEAYVGISDSDARGNYLSGGASGKGRSMALALTAAALRVLAQPTTTKKRR